MSIRYSDMVKVNLLDNPFIPKLQIWCKEITKKTKRTLSQSKDLDKELDDSYEVTNLTYEGSDFIKVSAIKLNEMLGDLTKTEYKLLRIIQVLIEEYYNFNGALELTLSIINDEKYIVGTPFSPKTFYPAIKTLCTPIDDKHDPVLIKHEKRSGIYWVNPVIFYRGYKKVLLERYHQEKKEKEQREARRNN